MPNYKSLSEDLKKKMKQAQKAIQKEIIPVVGTLAVGHFKESFHNGGFTNGGIKKWADVKRRDSKSPWYGFEYKGEKRTFHALTRDRKTGKTSKAKKQKPLNFSPAATMQKPLSSKRMELRNSLRSINGRGKVTISSDKPYAQVQNEGGTIKVFGKHPVKLTARPFMGESKELNQDVEKKVNAILNKILK